MHGEVWDRRLEHLEPVRDAASLALLLTSYLQTLGWSLGICVSTSQVILIHAQVCESLIDQPNFSSPCFLVLHHLPEIAQTRVHQVGDAIQPPHPLSSPSAFSLSQHHGLFQSVSSLHQVAKVLEFQLQHQSFQ